MLTINVGLSRKLTRDYNSTGFSLNLEGELCAGVDDPQTLIEKIKEYYDLAEEALSQQIERYEGESAMGRDETSPARRNGRTQGAPASSTDDQGGSQNRSKDVPPAENGNGHSTNGDAATNKQVQYLLNLGKRHGLTPPKLEARIEEILGKKVGVYDLTKREAGDVIDALSQNGEPVGNSNGRSRTTR